MNRDKLLFPETPPVLWGIKHFIFLDKLLPHRRLLQTKLQEKTSFDKSTLSKIKQDITRIGWCKDINLGSGREIKVELCKLNEIKLFLGYWEFMKQSILVRPHKIMVRAFLRDKPENFREAIEKFSINKGYRLIISRMKNNAEYTVETGHGKIIFFLKGNMVKFIIDGFILPVKKEDIVLLEDYVVEVIKDRALSMHSLAKQHFKRFGIEIFDIIYFDSMHMGIITKKNASKVVYLKNRIKELKMFVDESVYNCDEIEAKGELSSVLNKVMALLNDIFDKEP